MAEYDLAIIGGGINGTGLARDAAGRGLRVLLVEQNDLASGTSSASTKLIHGGLRYLEHGAFRLVREALHEREVLLRMAPHADPAAALHAAAVARRAFGAAAALWPVHLRHAGWTQAAARHAHRRSHPPSGRPAAQADRSVTASSFPTARSTMPGWSCSTRSMPPSAAPSSAPAPAAPAPSDAANGNWCSTRVDAAQVTTARVLVNAAGPWIGEVAETAIQRPLPAPVRLDQRQPHRGAAALWP